MKSVMIDDALHQEIKIIAALSGKKMAEVEKEAIDELDKKKQEGKENDEKK